MVILNIDDVDVFYSEVQVLDGISLSVDKQEVISILGRNGVGKTTLLRAIMGTVPVRSGSITYDDVDITDVPTNERSRMGLSLVPQSRRVFPNVSVEGNLEIADTSDGAAWSIAEVYDLFPRLEERKSQYGYTLSGGEQQMLAIARALVQNTSCLLLDEPFEGLAPNIQELVRESLNRITKEDITVLLVSQDTDAALDMSDRAYIIDNGTIAYQDGSEALKQDENAKSRLLGLG